MNKNKVLFVCLGNICRSPAAEGIFLKIVQMNNQNDLFYVDSAGTSGHHDGELPDSRMRQAAKRRNIDLNSLSRKFITEDFNRFDYIIVMDESNYQDVTKLDKNNEFDHKIYQMSDFADGKFKHFKKVPDPYFGGEEGFELVLDLLENTCHNFFNDINEK